MDTATKGTVTMSPDAVTGGSTAYNSTSGTWSDDDTVLTIPISGLTAGTTYTVNLSGFEDDNNGVPIADKIHSFTVAGSTPPGNNNGSSSANAKISPANADFDKYAESADYKDIAVTLTSGNYSPAKITYGGAALTEGSEYTKSGSVYTFKKEYLASLGIGAKTFTFDMGGGTDPVLTVTVTDSTPQDKPDTGEWQNPFTDVDKDDWFYGDVEWAETMDIFDGMTPTSFAPFTDTTRGMIVTVLGRMSGIDTAAYPDCVFDDVAAGQYYAPYVEWGRQNGVVFGVGNNRYNPDEPITRQDICAILYRYARLNGKTLPADQEADFADGNIVSEYARESVRALAGAGIVTGRPGRVFDPKAHATRAEVAAMLHRFVEAVK
jgi:hypothetical protein